MKKLSREEGSIGTAWLVAYLLSGVLPSLNVVIPGIFAYYGMSRALGNGVDAMTRYLLLIGVGMCALGAVLSHSNAKPQLAHLFAFLSAGLAVAFVKIKPKRRMVESEGTAWFVIAAILALSADVISRKEIFGRNTWFATLLLGLFATACAVWWLRRRAKAQQSTP